MAKTNAKISVDSLTPIIKRIMRENLCSEAAAIRDLLTDARHYAENRALNYLGIDKAAQEVYTEERGLDREQLRPVRNISRKRT